ncbi:glutamate--cysteine ligase [Streptomyces sp. NPDC048603]|uniref:carboxylate-amine ligase n=1 Tax=Streptomyces sp. NPDC048603 TaxID=3365577 RepID=UPI0037219446
MVTVGVEEEFLLLDAATGLPVPLADRVRAAAGLRSAPDEGEVQPELLQAQVEIATPVCGSPAEVARHLRRLRGAVAGAAADFACRLVASGTPPLKAADPVPVTDTRRYRGLRAQAPQLVAEQLINGMHVHVAVPDRACGVSVLNRVRVWLPTLVAMAANSPLWDGSDTGFASWRTVVFGRWPVSGPPPRFADLADHEARVRALLAGEVVLDRGQIYWQARLSERYPTVEVRCMDVQLRASDAALFAGLVRALVGTALRESEAGLPVPDCPPEMLQAANWHAARHGLGGGLLTPCGTLVSAEAAVRGLVSHVSPLLVESGDRREVCALAERLLREGTAAARQRRAFGSGGSRAVLDLITVETSDRHPSRI